MRGDSSGPEEGAAASDSTGAPGPLASTRVEPTGSSGRCGSRGARRQARGPGFGVTTSSRRRGDAAHPVMPARTGAWSAGVSCDRPRLGAARVSPHVSCGLPRSRLRCDAYEPTAALPPRGTNTAFRLHQGVARSSASERTRRAGKRTYSRPEAWCVARMSRKIPTPRFSSSSLPKSGRNTRSACPR